MSESPAPMRATRAAIFAAMCVALGAVGHSYMSGTDIPVAGLLGAFGVTGALAWLAAGRRRGPVGITAAVLAVQGVLHLVFSGSQAAEHAPGPAPASAPAPLPAAVPAPVHHHMPDMDMGGGTPLATDPVAQGGMAGTTDHLPDLAQLTDLSGMADMAGIAGHGGAGMIAAHVLAGLLCAGWLAWGEAAVFRLARTLGAAALHAARPLARALALVRARVAAPVAPPAFLPPYERPRRLRGAVHAHAVVRRGPPRGLFPRTTAPGRPARA
uniref:Integral membrane protein n=1 Tax=Streptomyces sp. NBC_00049 TaxID=2903617 RepID=A0AAU2JMB1_9ACTN